MRHFTRINFAQVRFYVRRSGIYILGIGASAYGLEKYFSDKMGLKVIVAEDAMYSVALGGGLAIDDKEVLKKICIEY